MATANTPSLNAASRSTLCPRCGCRRWSSRWDCSIFRIGSDAACLAAARKGNPGALLDPGRKKFYRHARASGKGSVGATTGLRRLPRGSRPCLTAGTHGPALLHAGRRLGREVNGFKGRPVALPKNPGIRDIVGIGFRGVLSLRLENDVRTPVVSQPGGAPLARFPFLRFLRILWIAALPPASRSVADPYPSPGFESCRLERLWT